MVLSIKWICFDCLLQRLMISVVLVEPEIPPNTGNVARLCAANSVPLHIVGVAGFRLDDRAVRRAGLDYWPEVELHRHTDLIDLYTSLPEARFVYLSTKGERSYTAWEFQDNDCLVFGRETRGLAETLLRENWERCLTIPMLNPRVRSLNLATAVGIVLYEALRQLSSFNLPPKPLT
jgi:tRNA (cytidine/uridine-2'-O-)-methyltransferase